MSRTGRPATGWVVRSVVLIGLALLSLRFEPFFDGVEDSLGALDHLRIGAHLLKSGVSIGGEPSGFGKPAVVAKRNGEGKARVGRLGDIALPLVIANGLTVVG